MKLITHGLFAVICVLAVACEYSAKADICVGETFRVSRVVGHVTVMWHDTEQPVANVRVELKQPHNDRLETRFTATTNETGWFHFDNVPSGTYQIEFTPEHFYPYGGWIRLKASRSQPKQELVVTVGLGVHFCASAKLRNLPAVQRQHAEQIVGSERRERVL
jgi:5-hydroxyisourate hydrolase-like protein (transthyretin family)